METLTNMYNALVNADFPVTTYGALSALLPTEPGPPHIPESLTHIDCYTNDIISAVKGGGIVTTPIL